MQPVGQAHSSVKVRGEETRHRPEKWAAPHCLLSDLLSLSVYVSGNCQYRADERQFDKCRNRWECRRACFDLQRELASQHSLRKKGAGTENRNGPRGALHFRYLTPFSRSELQWGLQSQPLPPERISLHTSSCRVELHSLTGIRPGIQRHLRGGPVGALSQELGKSGELE
jgi:hypothetical protein